MQTVGNPFQACKDIFLKPNRVFYTLSQVDNWSWVPFLIVTALSILPAYLYFSHIDFSWYQNYMVETQLADVSPAEQDTMRAYLTRETVLSTTVITVFLGVLLVNTLIAAYLNYATKFDKHNLNGFTDWYGLTWWISMPVVLSGLLSLLAILLAGSNQLEPNILSLTSLAFLLGVGMESNWYTFLMSVKLESFWCMYLCAVGISQWTQISTNKCYLIAVAPAGLIWSIWLLYLLF